MRFARLVALLLGVGLIVAAAAGYLTRGAELERERDARVRSAAEAGAAELGAVVDHLVVTTDLAVDADGAVAALGARGFTACAVPTATGTTVAADSVCGPGATEATADRTAPLLDRVSLGETALSVDERFVVVGAVGSDVTVALEHPVVALARTDGAVELAVVPSAGAPNTDPTTVADRRRAASDVGPLPEWSVVASTPDDVALPSAERTVLFVAALGGVLLLAFAGFTLLAQQRRLVERASIDPVTKLPNRSELEVRGEAMLAVARRAEEGVCVMLVDLDGFKAVNDTYGHAAGDDVLRVVAMRLRSAVRGYDIVARWGGDEFVIVLPGIDNEQFATSRASSLAEIVSRPLRADDADGPNPVAPGIGPQVGASIGIALLGEHGDTLVELIDAADAAMYEAKRDGLGHRVATTPTLARCSPVTH